MELRTIGWAASSVILLEVSTSGEPGGEVVGVLLRVAEVWALGVFIVASLHSHIGRPRQIALRRFCTCMHLVLPRVSRHSLINNVKEHYQMRDESMNP